MSDGSKIRSELDAAEISFQVLRQTFHRPRLGQTGQAFEQQVAVAKECQEQTFNYLLLTDDGLSNPFS